MSLCMHRYSVGKLLEFDGCNFVHRQEWIVEHLNLLTNMFAIDVASYAIVMNHCHVLVRVNLEKSTAWTTAETFEHWSMLFQVPDLINNTSLVT